MQKVSRLLQTFISHWAAAVPAMAAAIRPSSRARAAKSTAPGPKMQSTPRPISTGSQRVRATETAASKSEAASQPP